MLFSRHHVALSPFVLFLPSSGQEANLLEEGIWPSQDYHQLLGIFLSCLAPEIAKCELSSS